jgi:hypothetical protein
MKRSLLSGIAVLIILISCKKTDTEVFFKVANGTDYKFSEIELYDTSSNILYFRNVHDELNNLEKNAFTFVDNGDAIYSGTFWPAYFNSGPDGPFIYSPPMMFGNYALRIDNWHPGKPDVRDDPRMIAVLKQHDLFHSGLAFTSSSIDITGLQLTFKFNLTNQDKSDLLILDPDKTGPNLFHFFTFGLYIEDQANNEIFTSNIKIQNPDPLNLWKIEWLSLLKSGESRQFTINYTLKNPILPGQYISTFTYPGLAYQVTKDQLYQGNSRIWLGGIQLTKKLVIQ